jgi:hypothetical protein
MTYIFLSGFDLDVRVHWPVQAAAKRPLLDGQRSATFEV